MGVMTILFWVVFVMVVRYLISVFKLVRQVRMSEPDLWVSLGSPTMFPIFHVSLNPFKGLFAQMQFFNWVIKGGAGAEAPATKTMVKKARRLFRIAMIGFVSIFLLFFVTLGSLTFMMVITEKG